MVGHGVHAPEARFGDRVAPPPRLGRKTSEERPLSAMRSVARKVGTWDSVYSCGHALKIQKPTALYLACKIDAELSIVDAH